MSKAGIQSNRGDGYQTLVAFHWALIVLSDPNYEWLEVDSVTWLVDDVVIGKADGTRICCQCKKNQSGFQAWTVNDLADELVKAGRMLASDSQTSARFYSRSPFGELAALREYSTNYPDAFTYLATLPSAHAGPDKKLNDLLITQAIGLTTYDFLCRTEFETSGALDQMKLLLRERLHQLASDPSAAYNALWTRLDQLGMRVDGQNPTAATQHRLTKGDLRELILQAGSVLTPPLDKANVRTSFQSTSAIGRSWCREIGSERISSPIVDDLVAAIKAKHRSILLTGLPGSGKTCVMLALQERLEDLAKTQIALVPLFIQSREFADMDSAQDRESQGLSRRWVEEVARFAEDAHVVVVIDSLDVLSIAREHNVLAYFLAQIDRLRLISNVTVVTACREFDRYYDRRIAILKWDKEFMCRPWEWDADIAPLLKKIKLTPLQ